MKIDLVAEPDDALRRAIAAPLLAFNEALAGPSAHQTLALSVRDADGVVRGGLWGATAHGWLYTQMLVVPEPVRGRGLGRDLLLAAEAEARRRGCTHAWVASWSTASAIRRLSRTILRKPNFQFGRGR